MTGAENCFVRSFPKVYPGGELDSAFAWERGWKAVSCRRRIGNLVRMAETAQHSLAKAGLEWVADGWSRQQIFNSDGNG